MFDVGWTEMLVIAVVMIVVVGPKDLPRMLRTFGKTTAKLRAMAGDFRKQFDEALKEAELDDVKTLASDMRKLNPAADIRKALNPIEQTAAELKSGIDAAMKPRATPDASAEPASATAAAGEPLKTGAVESSGTASSAPAVALSNGHDTVAKATTDVRRTSVAKSKPAAPAKPKAAKRAAAKKTPSKTGGKK